MPGRVGLVHAAVNTTAPACYAASLVARMLGRRKPGWRCRWWGGRGRPQGAAASQPVYETRLANGKLEVRAR